MTGDGLDEVWAKVLAHQEGLDLAAKRRRQQVGWTWTLVKDRLLAELRADPRVAEISAEVEREVLAGELTPALAAERILSAFTRS
ncbi:hypothetical protein GCM10020001_085150 [Nonomuraea salmonea]